MALGLNFLGEEDSKLIRGPVLFHVLGASLAGAIMGAGFAVIGSVLSLSEIRSWVIAMAFAASLLLGTVRRGRFKLGVNRQVPRRLPRQVPVESYYTLCGLLLGAGILTIIPHSVVLIFLGALLTVDPIFGCVVGAVYGASRESLVLIPLARHFDPAQTMALLPRCEDSAARLNNLAVAFAGVVLLVAS